MVSFLNPSAHRGRTHDRSGHHLPTRLRTSRPASAGEGDRPGLGRLFDAPGEAGYQYDRLIAFELGGVDVAENRGSQSCAHFRGTHGSKISWRIVCGMCAKGACRSTLPGSASPATVLPLPKSSSVARQGANCHQNKCNCLHSDDETDGLRYYPARSMHTMNVRTEAAA